MDTYQIEPNFQNAPHFQYFWQHGNGKELIEWTKAEVSLRDFNKFAPLYYQVDELGDQVVKDVYLKKSFSEKTSIP